MDMYGEIRRLYIQEHKSIRKIAKELHISRTTVKKYCEGAWYPGLRADYHREATVITPDVQAFILRCIEADKQEANRKQRHTAHRIYTRLVEEMGFKGSESNVRRVVHRLRGTLQDAYVPLAFNPGEAMQIDWGTYEVLVDGQKTKINAFCARLCFSCAPFVICFRRQNTEAFAEAIIAALEYFGGVPRRVIFDNARLAVKEGGGKDAVAQETYKILSSHYNFETVFCNIRSGNEKGLVEGLVGWTRSNFFVPRPEAFGELDLDAINAGLRERCETYAKNHTLQGRKASVADMLATERSKLLPLPLRRYDPAKVVPDSVVSSMGIVRFQTNSYSVPIERVGEHVTLRAYAEKVDIYWQGRVIASHKRSYGRYEEILSLSHYLPLLKRKPRSIMQARPVKASLSQRTLEWMERMAFSAQELINLLGDCAEHGEEWMLANRERYLQGHDRPAAIADRMPVCDVDLIAYEQLFQMEGGAGQCQTQTHP